MSNTVTIAYCAPAFDLASESGVATLYRDLWRELALSFQANAVELEPDAPVDALACDLRAKPVVVHPNGSIPLHRFRHPKARALYIFGPEDRSIDPSLLDRFSSVRIPTAETHHLWGPIAAGIVLNDRARR